MLLFIPFLGGLGDGLAYENQDTVHFFEDSRCPDCAKQKNYMEDVLLEEYPDLQIKTYEISKTENQKLLEKKWKSEVSRITA